jgi:hypothetical protein
VMVYAFLRPNVGKGACDLRLPKLETLMAKELKKRRDEAKQAWENATVVMKTAKKVSDFTGVRKAHDEAEKLLKAEKASESDSDDSDNTLAMSAHG